MDVYGIDGLNKINSESCKAESDKADIDNNDVKGGQQVISTDDEVDKERYS